MELRHLRYFVAVAEEEHFHRAAAKLHVSQSPLSRQLRQLKEELGVALFEPSGRGVKLTLAGRQFLERAKEILASVDAAAAEAREAAAGTLGTIAIGFEPGSGYVGLLTTVVSALERRQPRVNLKLSPMISTEQWDALRAGKIALAYGNELPDDPALRCAVLSRTRLGIRLPARHPLARKAALEVEDLAHEPVLMGPRRLRPRLYDELIAALHARGVVLNPGPEVVDGEAVWTLVNAGRGLTFAAENGARFLDAGASADAPHGASVWKPLRNLGVELLDVACWRADAERAPLLQPLLEIVATLSRRAAARRRPGSALRRTPHR